MSIMAILGYSLVAILTMLITKLVYAVVKLLTLPKKNGENSWTFYALLMFMWDKLPYFLIVAVITGVVTTHFGGGIGVVLFVAATFGFIDSFLEF